MGVNFKFQTAGNNSTEIQAENVFIGNNITDESAKAIFAVLNCLTRELLAEKARHIVDERIGQFEERFMPKFSQLENALQFFADPSFKFLLRQAQLAAAQTDQKSDYDLLTELLASHVQNGQDRKNRTAISQAVQIVDKIDNNALCGLTVVNAFWRHSPPADTCKEYLTKLDDHFTKILYCELPSGGDWIDHLDVLGAVRFLYSGYDPSHYYLKTVRDYCSRVLHGIICVGVKEDSEDFKTVVSLLKDSNLHDEIWVPHDCLEGYYRLAINRLELIDCLQILNGTEFVPLSQEQKQTLFQIYKMYSKDPVLKRQVKINFIKQWDSFESLQKFRRWWERNPFAFAITSVGEVLAVANAKRCDPMISH